MKRWSRGNLLVMAISATSASYAQQPSFPEKPPELRAYQPQPYNENAQQPYSDPRLGPLASPQASPPAGRQPSPYAGRQPSPYAGRQSTPYPGREPGSTIDRNRFEPTQGTDNSLGLSAVPRPAAPPKLSAPTAPARQNGLEWQDKPSARAAPIAPSRPSPPAPSFVPKPTASVNSPSGPLAPFSAAPVQTVPSPRGHMPFSGSGGTDLRDPTKASPRQLDLPEVDLPKSK